MVVDADHVSSRAFGFHRKVAPRLGVTFGELLEGTGIDERTVDTYAHVPWGPFVASLARLERAAGGREALVGYGRLVNQPETYPFFARILGHVVEPRLLAEVAGRWAGPTLFPCVTMKLTWLGRRRVFYEVHVPEQLEGSETFIAVGLAGMQTLPAWLSLPDAEGPAVVENGRYGWADLTLPDHKSLRKQLTRLAGYMSSNRRLVGELVAQNEALRAQKAALVAATKEADEQRRRAERASRVKSDFVAAVSHEMRTPLNALHIATQLLAGSELSPAQREHADVVLRASRHMTRVLEDLIDLEGIEAGHLRFDAKPFSLRSLADEVVSMLGADAEARGLSLEVELAPELPPLVVGDAARVRQVLLNLVSNAIRYTSVGGARILLSSPAPARVRIAVADTGPGVDEEELGHIFEPFVQGRARASSRGAGLGLTISRLLVKRMGGEIGVESVSGEGATFWCELPLRAPVEPRRVSAGDPGGGPGGTGPAREVLLVEDDELTRKVFLVLLRSLGCRVDVAEDGARAVQRCAEKRYDLVLMDCQMPVMGGLEATRVIRGATGPNQDTCIVGLTAGTREAEPALWSAAGMTNLLHKPLDTSALRALLDALPEPDVEPQRRSVPSPGR